MNINFNVCGGYIKSEKIGSSGMKNYSAVNISDRVSAKKDTVSISPEAESFREVNRTTKAMASEISKSASKDRINSLKAQIAAGTYNVSSGDVADAILDRMAF